jgi:hypothetical protein
MLARSNRRLSVATAFAAALTVVLAVLAISATGASAFSIAGFWNTPSTTAAGQHPNLTSEVNFNPMGLPAGIEGDLTELSITMPPGLTLNRAAVPVSSMCTDQQFKSDLCSDASQIGTLIVNMNVEGVGSVQVPGSAYVRVSSAGLLDGDLATWGIVLRPNKICVVNGFCAIPKKLLLDDHVRFVDPTVTYLKESISGIPNYFTDVNGAGRANFTITGWKFTRQARVNRQATGDYFVTNSTSCQLTASQVLAISTDGSSFATAPYLPTSCSSVPVSIYPTITPGDATIETSTSVTAGASIGMSTGAQGTSRLKSATLLLPRGSVFVQTGLSTIGNCTTGLVLSSSCPTNTILGTVSAASPEFPEGFSGTAYLTSKTAPYSFVAKVNGPRASSFVLQGSVDNYVDPAPGPGVIPGRMRIQFVTPELTLSSLKVKVNAPRYYLSDGNCGPHEAKIDGTFLGYRGLAVNTSSSYATAMCL